MTRRVSRFSRLPGRWLPTLLWGLLLAMAWQAVPARAQSGDAVPYSEAELETLVGPIALYSDELVAVILPAAAYPVQIVQAARYLEAAEADSSLQPDPSWDDAVVALLNYPELLQLMSDNLRWTEQLGEAVVLQEDDVLAAIQDFRARALAAGNLRSDERQTVSEKGGHIAIAPADPRVVYLPRYEPQTVIVYQSVPVWGYFPQPYPVYCYPYPAGYSFALFGPRPFWGVSTAFAIGWHSYALNVYYHGSYGHPYYGRPYHRPYYTRYHVDARLRYADHHWRPRGHWHSDGYRRYTAQREQTRAVVSRDGYARGDGRVASVERHGRVAAPTWRAEAGARNAAAPRSRTAVAGAAPNVRTGAVAAPRERRAGAVATPRLASATRNPGTPSERRVVARTENSRRVTTRTGQAAVAPRAQPQAVTRDRRAAVAANGTMIREQPVRVESRNRAAGVARSGTAVALAPRPGQARVAAQPRPDAPSPRAASRDLRAYGGATALARAQPASRGSSFAGSQGNARGRSGGAAAGWRPSGARQR